MTRVPRNPGTGKPPHNGPASNRPAYGISLGPAKGAGTGGPKRPRTAADSQRSVEVRTDPQVLLAIERRKMSKEERAADVLDFLEGIALDPAKAAAAMKGPVGILGYRIIAGKESMDRLDGRPAQTIRGQQLDKDGNPTDPVVPALSVTISRE